MDPDTDVCQTEQPQISYSVDFTAEQVVPWDMGSPILLSAICYLLSNYPYLLSDYLLSCILLDLDREGTVYPYNG